ncbi:MAG TPA: hypothetical protein VL614_06630 [Acetobacteraceae bacterium]|jgi:hypothetical protein|nr:hypothetical protein [Acetobacteraceae bacterium]
MLLVSFTLLLIVAASGSVLAVLGFRFEVPPPAQVYGVLHGCLGAGGFAALLMALRGPPRGVAMGVGSFGAIAAVLLGVALLAGLIMLVMRARVRQVPGLIIGIHATIAISGIVILTAYTLLG